METLERTVERRVGARELEARLKGLCRSRGWKFTQNSNGDGKEVGNGCDEGRQDR